MPHQPRVRRSFGVDFNPAANRLRVISDAGQNLRHNIDDPVGAPAAGTTAVDGTLTTPPVPPATTGAVAAGLTGAAYTNNGLDATTATTLFDLDTAQDQIAVRSPADAGSNVGYAVTGSRVCRINLLTGRATSAGSFAQGRQVVDLAIPLRQG